MMRCAEEKRFDTCRVLVYGSVDFWIRDTDGL
jgi:hypothetical protein